MRAATVEKAVDDGLRRRGLSRSWGPQELEPLPIAGVEGSKTETVEVSALCHVLGVSSVVEEEVVEGDVAQIWAWKIWLR